MSDETTRLLVIEDEEHLARGLKLNLELEGHRVDLAPDAREAGRLMVRADAYDLVILDVMLPGLDGFQFCERLRDAGQFVPVIMITVRSAPADRVRGLEAGADDYLVKPFELDELMARVRSQLRRRRWEHREAGPSSGHSVLTFGRARVDLDTHEVLVDGEPQRLTRLELDLLRYFAERPGRVLGRAELLEQVWGLSNHPDTRTVDNFVLRLRRHFEPEPKRPVHFVSVRGTGYRFEPDPDRAGHEDGRTRGSDAP